MAEETEHETLNDQIEELNARLWEVWTTTRDDAIYPAVSPLVTWFSKLFG